MVELRHAYKTYPGPVHALHGINLLIQKGEFAFLTGPSGAGKTTLFRVLSAFDTLSSGSVSVLGYTVGDLSDYDIAMFRRNIGVVYQDFRLLNNRTVFENVALPLEIRGESESYIKNRVNDVLNDVSLLQRADDSPLHLSGGEQQRVAIARALVHRPGLLIADEPTGNLDQKLSLEIISLFERVNSQGTTIFIATHDQQLVKSRNHRVIEIEGGKVIRS